MGAACAIKINPFQKDIWLINKGDIPKTVTIISILSLYAEGDTAIYTIQHAIHTKIYITCYVLSLDY